jgi:hypothetical protein
MNTRDKLQIILMLSLGVAATIASVVTSTSQQVQAFTEQGTVSEERSNNNLIKKYDSLQKEGTFFISDAGRSHGGFEFNAEYKTKFDVQNGKGTLTFSLELGLDDPLKTHVYRITDLLIKPNKVLMKIDNHPVELVLVKNDKIWNHQFDYNYIAAWGSDAPMNEIKGSISPDIFPGLVDFWYVELRIPKN